MTQYRKRKSNMKFYEFQEETHMIGHNIVHKVYLKSHRSHVIPKDIMGWYASYLKLKIKIKIKGKNGDLKTYSYGVYCSMYVKKMIVTMSPSRKLTKEVTPCVCINVAQRLLVMWATTR